MADKSRPAEVLTEKRIAKLVEPGRRYRDGLTHGLYLQVTKGGARSWILRYELHGRERMMGLGPVSAFSLKEARARARLARQQLVDGVDPLDAKREARKADRLASARRLSFRDAAEAYIVQHRAEWRSVNHARDFSSSLRRFVYPTLGGMDVSAIETPDILRALQPVWETKTVSAKRVLNRVEMILNWCMAAGHRPAGLNPARWQGHLDQVLPQPQKIAKTKSFAALPYTQLPAFMERLRACEGLAARALEFTILAAARSGEVLKAVWSEIDLDNATWTIPAGRMKAGREHKVPLSPSAVAMLGALPREDNNAFVFIGARAGRGLDKNAMTSVLAHLGRDDVTVHGFRAAFKTWAEERTNYNNHAIEQSLAHSIGNAVEQAYQRGDLFEKRQQLIESWATFCNTPLPKGATVTPIRRGVS